MKRRKFSRSREKKKGYLSRLWFKIKPNFSDQYLRQVLNSISNLKNQDISIKLTFKTYRSKLMDSKKSKILRIKKNYLQLTPNKKKHWI
jgi:hypothetical protein